MSVIRWRFISSLVRFGTKMKFIGHVDANFDLFSDMFSLEIEKSQGVAIVTEKNLKLA